MNFVIIVQVILWAKHLLCKWNNSHASTSFYIGIKLAYPRFIEVMYLHVCFKECRRQQVMVKGKIKEDSTKKDFPLITKIVFLKF